LVQNYKKTLNKEKSIIKKNYYEINKLKLVISDYIQVYNDKLHTHSEFLNQIYLMNQINTTLNSCANEFVPNILNSNLSQNPDGEKVVLANIKKHDMNAERSKKIAGLRELKIKNQINVMDKMKEKISETFEIDEDGEIIDPKYHKFLENLEEKRDLEREKQKLMIWLSELKKKKKFMDIVIYQNSLRADQADSDEAVSGPGWRQTLEKRKADVDLPRKRKIMQKRSDVTINSIDAINELTIKLKLASPLLLKSLFFDSFPKEEILSKISKYSESVKTQITAEDYQDLIANTKKPFLIAEKYIKLEETIPQRDIDTTHKWIHFKNSYGYDKFDISEHENSEDSSRGSEGETGPGIEDNHLMILKDPCVGKPLKHRGGKKWTGGYRLDTFETTKA
jgi:hypothetical protein